MKTTSLTILPEESCNRNKIISLISNKTGIAENEIIDYRIIRQSIDARKKVKFNLEIEFITEGEVFLSEKTPFIFNDVRNSETVIIVGAGPAGYFAAIQCLLSNIKPIIFERGKSIDDRNKDIAIINKNFDVNPDSNYLFGEGGAGTYSDGKLFTRSKKRGDNKIVLQLLHYFGAEESVLIDSHPHIGTDKLHSIMRNIRNKIIDCGGEIYFEKKVVDIITKNNKRGILLQNGEEVFANNIVFACGHSARDTFEIYNRNNIAMESKGFAMGVRVEHPQELINKIQYKQEYKNKYLPPASYNLVTQTNNRGVYSFCMCPGGIIVNSSSKIGEIVVNGMSNSKRNSPYANSGIVVELRPEDYCSYSNISAFAGLEMQKELEELAFKNSNNKLTAPAQRLTDFMAKKESEFLPKSSYSPGLTTSPLHKWLPAIIKDNLSLAFKDFDKKMHGFISNEAIIVGVESRTSSPIRILRNSNFETSVENIYVCGEGSGFSGGIVSSAIDGMEIIKKIIINHK